jgi:hypothetical protein
MPHWPWRHWNWWRQTHETIRELRVWRAWNPRTSNGQSSKTSSRRDIFLTGLSPARERCKDRSQSQRAHGDSPIHTWSVLYYIWYSHVISTILYMVFTRDQSADSITRESRPAASFSRALLDKRRGSWQRKIRCWRRWIGQNLSRPCEQRDCCD